MIKKTLITSSIGLFAIGTASAAAIIPTGITAFHEGDSATGTGSTLRTIDGSGMDQPDTNDPSTWTVNNNGWQEDWQGQATPSADATWAVLDLGGPTASLDKMYLWNVQENITTTNLGSGDRGMNTFNLWYATSPTLTPPATSATPTNYSFASGGWTQLGGTLTLPLGTGNGDAGTSFNVAGASGAQYIGIEILSNHGGTRTGFAEVAFTTVPEPASSALLLVGGLIGLTRRRR